MQKEAKARIKINTLLQEAGWRFFDDENGRANIALEAHTKIKQQDIDALGNDFEKTKHGFIDFLLLDEKGFPYAVLEAKSEDKSPLDGKEQARRYAKSQNVRYAQQMTINFTNNNLNGQTSFLEGYKSSKTRACVTVGMMTTGYDCEDILNLCWMKCSTAPQIRSVPSILATKIAPSTRPPATPVCLRLKPPASEATNISTALC